MTIYDSLHYLAVGNPVSKVVIGTTASLFNNQFTKSTPLSTAKMSKPVVNVMPSLWQLAGRNHNFIRLAGVSGAAAVVLGAIGSHSSSLQEKPEMRVIFDNANRFHFFHSLALLGVPLAKYPMVTGTLMVMGTALFSGCLYYRAFTGNKPPFARMAPMGGTFLIAAWLTFLL